MHHGVKSGYPCNWHQPHSRHKHSMYVQHVSWLKSSTAGAKSMQAYYQVPSGYCLATATGCIIASGWDGHSSIMVGVTVGAHAWPISLLRSRICCLSRRSNDAQQCKGNRHWCSAWRDVVNGQLMDQNISWELSVHVVIGCMLWLLLLPQYAGCLLCTCVTGQRALC